MKRAIIIAILATALVMYTDRETADYSPPTLTVTPQAVIEVSSRDVECLAKNIYFEARGESEKGQIAVAAVTVNRLQRDEYPSSICKVVYQPYQFSWVHELDSHTPKNREAYNKAIELARAYLEGKLKDPTNGATHYHANYVNPRWSKKLEKVNTIGNHVFYVKN